MPEIRTPSACTWLRDKVPIWASVTCASWGAVNKDSCRSVMAPRLTRPNCCGVMAGIRLARNSWIRVPKDAR